jgi:hypothetical protein
VIKSEREMLSNEIRKAEIAPAMTPPLMRGRVMFRNVRTGPTPRFIEARSSERS